MSKEIWLGPVLGSDRERLLARCARYVSSGQTGEFLYIAASHPLLDLVAERLLDGKDSRGVWGEFPVYLFRGFVRRILSSAVVSEARPREPQPGSPAGVGRSGTATARTEPVLIHGLLTPDSATALVPRVPIDHEELPLRRSLISQIIKQLSASRKLKAIGSLANRNGCINTIASLIGELQRAGKTPAEFQNAIAMRAAEESAVPNAKSQKARSALRPQLDFDRDVALIYAAYSEALDHFGLTDEDADQLRALQILRRELDGRAVSLPWLDQVDLLVLDGFFDFTPVQGEMLRQLIPAIPNVIVNVNHDQTNKEIFRPFESTIEQLKSIADFELKHAIELNAPSPELTLLRERLFNVAQVVNLREHTEARSQVDNSRYTLFESSDRETEIRSIVKEVKRLVLQDGYALSDIGLVVRERTSYAETILRVCADESIPCDLERRIEAKEISCVRACGKLFELLSAPVREHVTNPKTIDIAHLVKSGYFRVSSTDLSALVEAFDNRYRSLLEADSRISVAKTLQNDDARERRDRLRFQLGVGRWAPDVLENVFAYVGSELRADAWLKRAERLITALPTPDAARSFIGSNDVGEDDGALAITEREAPEDLAEKKAGKAPAPVHPATIAWTIVVLEHLRRLISAVPGEGSAEELRAAIMSLLDQLEFSKQTTLPFFKNGDATEIAQATLDARGLEGLRRANVSAVRSFNYAHQIVSVARPSGRAGTTSEPLLTRGLLTQVPIAAFIDEVDRCLNSQILSVGSGNRDGLRVLEATDVRGLRFRALFIAGMTEGGFPLRTSGDWLYPDEERERLRKYGVTLEDISHETLLKEEHYFYQAACRATDRLYLTRPLALNDGTETVASYYIEELKRAIALATLNVVQVRADIDTQDLRQASTHTEFSTMLVRQSERRDGKVAQGLIPKSTLEKLLRESEARGFISNSALRRVAIERERNGLGFGPFDGEISSADLRAMLHRHFGPEYVYSASSLSTYGKCPFRFFASRVLKLEPRNEAALDLPAIDAGKLLHEILRRFFALHRGQYLPSLDREELRTEMATVAEDVFREHELLVPALNERIWKIDCEIRKLILDQVLLFELRLQERTKSSKMRPIFFELAFGRSSGASDPKSRADYLKLDRPDESETALIQGQIDRVDVNDEERVAIAYDYKLSQGARITDIEAGREVQIPIYLAALEQLFVPGYELAGGGYYRLRPRTSRLNQGLYRQMFANCTYVTGKNFQDDIVWQRIREVVRRRVWQFIDGMRAGNFRVRPSLGKQTCKFCDYSAVCRYDTYRISRKRGSTVQL